MLIAGLLRDNFRRLRPGQAAYDHEVYLRALDAAGFNQLNISASGVQTFNYYGVELPGTLIPASQNLTKDLVTSFHSQVNRMGYKEGLIFTRDSQENEVVNYGTDYGIKIITSHTVEDIIRERKSELEELIEDFRKVNHNIPLFKDKDLFKSLIQKVKLAVTNDEKKTSLESLAYRFIESIGLIPERNVRTPSGEIDIFVRNNKMGAFWASLNTPILIECKNTKKPAKARQIREFKEKMGNLKTGFFISWSGVSGDDEWHDAKKVIQKAWNQGKVLLVFQDVDFEKISNGSTPENILYMKYYEHWKQYEG